MSKADKVDAYISRNEDGLKIHIGCLTIELVQGDSLKPGPLGWEDGQNPGVVFWESNHVEVSNDSFKHGEQQPIAFEELRQSDVEEMIETVNHYTRPDSE